MAQVPPIADQLGSLEKRITALAKVRGQRTSTPIRPEMVYKTGGTLYWCDVLPEIFIPLEDSELVLSWFLALYIQAGPWQGKTIRPTFGLCTLFSALPMQ